MASYQSPLPLRLVCSNLFGTKINVIFILVFFGFDCIGGKGACAAILNQHKTRPGKPHKISTEQFLNLYGADDSSRALIKSFSRIRRSSAKGLLLGVGLGSVSSLLFHVLITNGTPSQSMNNTGALAGGFFLGLAALFGGILIVAHTSDLLFNSRKRLYNLLIKYKNGKGVPRQIARKNSFKKFLALEQGY